MSTKNKPSIVRVKKHSIVIFFIGKREKTYSLEKKEEPKGHCSRIQGVNKRA